jgi:hypothetical protein
MVTQLLFDPELHQRVLSQTAKELLTSLDFQKSAVVNDQFEGELEAHMVGRRLAWWLWDTRSEVLWSSRRGLVVAAIIKEVSPPQSKLVQNVAGLAPDIAAQQDAVEVVANRERGMAVIMRWATHFPLAVEFTATAAPLNNSQCTVARRAA